MCYQMTKLIQNSNFTLETFTGHHLKDKGLSKSHNYFGNNFGIRLMAPVSLPGKAIPGALQTEILKQYPK